MKHSSVLSSDENVSLLTFVTMKISALELNSDFKRVRYLRSRPIPFSQYLMQSLLQTFKLSLNDLQTHTYQSIKLS